MPRPRLSSSLHDQALDVALEVAVNLVEKFNNQKKEKSLPPEITGRVTPWIDQHRQLCLEQQSEIAERERNFVEKLDITEHNITNSETRCYVCKPRYVNGEEKPPKTWIYIEGNGFGVYPFDENFRKPAWVALADQTNSNVIVICTPDAELNLVLEEQAKQLADALLILSQSQQYFSVAENILVAGYSSGATLLLLALNQLCSRVQVGVQPTFKPHFIGMVPFVQPMFEIEERHRLYPKSDTLINPREKPISNNLEGLGGNASYAFYFSMMCRLTPQSQGARDGQRFALDNSHFLNLIHQKMNPVIHNLTQDPLSPAVIAAANNPLIKRYDYQESHNSLWCKQELIKQITNHLSQDLHGIEISESILLTKDSRILPRKRSFSFDASPTDSRQTPEKPQKRRRSESLGEEPSKFRSKAEKIGGKGVTLFSQCDNSQPPQNSSKLPGLNK